MKGALTRVSDAFCNKRTGRHKKVIALVVSCFLLAFLFSAQLPTSAYAFDNSGWFWPVPDSNTMSRGYSEGHKAIDIISTRGVNETVVAARAGTVIAVYEGCSVWAGQGADHSACNPVIHLASGDKWGNRYLQSDGGTYVCNYGIGVGVVIDHHNGYITEYAHMATVSVSVGMDVAMGSPIGTMGAYGNANGRHLHFAIKNGTLSSGGHPEGTPANTNPYGDEYVIQGSWNGTPNIPYIRNYNHDPSGALDDCSGGVCSVRVRGWAKDPDTPAQSLTVHVYVGGPTGSGAKCYPISANKYRSDLGGYFGYDETIQVDVTGTQPVYVYAINSQEGNNPCIGSSTVTISPKVTPTAISISNSLTLQAGKSQSLSVTYTPSDTHSDYKGVSWSSSNTGVATVNSSGRVTAVSEGTAVITATSTYKSSLKATCTVTVTKAIPVPTITGADVDDYSVHLTWNPSELIDGQDVRTYTVNVYTNSFQLVDSQTGITDEFYDFNVSGPGTYRVTVTAVNDTTGATSSAASQTFTVGWVITKDWQTSNSLPAGVTPETCEIEYKHTYRTTAQSSPGAEWTRGSVAREEWVNSGEPYVSVTKLDTSDARQEILTGWYHFCGPEANRAGNFEQTGNFVHWDEFWDTNPPSRIREEYLGDDYGHPYYHIYVDGSSSPFYCQSGVTCDGSYGSHGERCKVWYRAYKYQDRTKNTYYYYTKTSDWTTVKDDSAYSVQYRFRLKDTGAPVVDSISVTALTPNNFTLLCKASDDTGIAKVVFASWTDVESETSPVTQEITLESTKASAEASVTITIADHNNVRDSYYNVKAYVYDGRGNVTEYECDSVYVPTIVHSARKLVLPAGLIEIQDEAFEGSIGFGEVVIPDGAESIGSKAFSGCGRLTLIHIPDTVAEIASDAFLDSSNVVIFCDAGSYAAQYAHTNHIPYVTGE